MPERHYGKVNFGQTSRDDTDSGVNPCHEDTSANTKHLGGVLTACRTLFVESYCGYTKETNDHGEILNSEDFLPVDKVAKDASPQGRCLDQDHQQRYRNECRSEEHEHEPALASDDPTHNDFLVAFSSFNWIDFLWN